ncbi:MAG: Rieske (2Fe-2S) protein [Phycisphaerae bacterium]
MECTLLQGYDRIIEVSALTPDGLFRGLLRGQGYLITMVGGDVIVLEDRCPHADFPLSSSRREGDCVICPMHHGVFDLKTGESVGLRKFNPLCRVPSRIVDGYVEIWVDQPESASAATESGGALQE